MKPVRGYIFFALLLYGFFLLVNFPAAKAYSLLQKKFPEASRQVRISGLAGSVWAGSAAQISRDSLELTAVSWRLHLQSVLSGRLGAMISGRIPGGYGQGLLSYGRGVLEVSKAEARFPAEFLNLISSSYGVELGGEMSVTAAHAVIRDGMATAAAGNFVWSGAEVEMAQKVALGDLKATAATDDNGVITVAVADNGGPLEVQGEFQLKPDGGYQFSGLFLSRDSTQPMLEEGLRLVGKPDPGGKIRINFTGKMPKLAI